MMDCARSCSEQIRWYESVYTKAYSAIRKRMYYAIASLIVMIKSRARGIRIYAQRRWIAYVTHKEAMSSKDQSPFFF